MTAMLLGRALPLVGRAIGISGAKAAGSTATAGMGATVQRSLAVHGAMGMMGGGSGGAAPAQPDPVSEASQYSTLLNPVQFQPHL